jgi:hypothetical protein
MAKIPFLGTSGHWAAVAVVATAGKLTSTWLEVGLEGLEVVTENMVATWLKLQVYNALMA